MSALVTYSGALTEGNQWQSSHMILALNVHKITPDDIRMVKTGSSYRSSKYRASVVIFTHCRKWLQRLTIPMEMKKTVEVGGPTENGHHVHDTNSWQDKIFSIADTSPYPVSGSLHLWWRVRVIPKHYAFLTSSGTNVRPPATAQLQIRVQRAYYLISFKYTHGISLYSHLFLSSVVALLPGGFSECTKGPACRKV